MRTLISRVFGHLCPGLWLLVLPTLVFGVKPVTISLRAQTPAATRPQGLDQIPDLVAGLKAVEGCLGVETAHTTSGKNVIFAWFEDKAACLRWYSSDMHQGVKNAFFPARGAGHVPMQDVPDEVGPILAIASLTPADPSKPDASGSPFSQISIELYTPLKGGVHIGGTFAPASLKVPKRKVIVDED